MAFAFNMQCAEVLWEREREEQQAVLAALGMKATEQTIEQQLLGARQ